MATYFDTIDKKCLFEKELRKELYQYNIVPLKKGDVIIKQNSYIRFHTILVEGMLRAYKQTEDREILLHYINQGENCAVSIGASFEQKKINFQVEACQESKVLQIPIFIACDWFRRYPSWKDFIILSLLKRQDQLLASFDEIAFSKIDKRIIDYLNELCNLRNSNLIPITHQELANELGTTRVVISRILKSLESQGFIELLRGNIRMKNMV